MRDLHEASFYETGPDRLVRCTLCPHDCRILDGARGACGVRVNCRGTLYTLVHDKVVAGNAEPIEKKPLFHFLPGSRAYSIATVGCPLRCTCCQNWDISQWPRSHLPRRLVWEPDPQAVRRQVIALEKRIPGDALTPPQIVEAAIAGGCRSIACTFVEPTAFFELAFDTAVLARERGLKSILVTCGYISEAPLRRIAPFVDAVNVDLKFFRDEDYRRIGRARLAPVLNAIRLYHDLGVWTEVTTLVIPGINDADEDLRGIADFIRSVGAEVPWHVTRFHPAHRMTDRPPTPPRTLHRARKIGLDAGLRYVYTGNVPAGKGQSTRCPDCASVLIERQDLELRSNRIRDGACPTCAAVIDGVGMDGE